MKRAITLILVLCMCMSLCACGGGNKKAFEASKAAYDNIDVAYEITDEFSHDLYEAWRLGIYDDDEIMDDGVEYLAKELKLSEDELIEGIVYSFCGGTDEDYANASEEDKEKYRGYTDLYFSFYEDNLFSACVWIVTYAYAANGKTAEAQAALDAAKAQMRELSEKYSDYEHYPNLKGYYTTASSFFDFCQNPTGSFEQVKTTINDYRNEARDFISDLDYIFED